MESRVRGGALAGAASQGLQRETASLRLTGGAANHLSASGVIYSYTTSTRGAAKRRNVTHAQLRSAPEALLLLSLARLLWFAVTPSVPMLPLAHSLVLRFQVATGGRLGLKKF